MAAAADLVQHQDAGVLQLADQFLVHIPEQRDGRHPQFEAGAHLFGEQLLRRGGRDQVDGEGALAEHAVGADFPADQLHRLADHAQAAETAGVAHRGGEFVAGDAAHAGGNDRDLASQQVHQRGVQGGMRHGGSPRCSRAICTTGTTEILATPAN
ncbi:hypothetical protein D3C81_1571160 [compost metagenome]